MECLIGGVAVFTQDLFNAGRSKAKHVAKMGALGARLHGDFDHTFFVQYRWKYDMYKRIDGHLHV